MDIYELFFSICIGLFLGGLLLATISIILAEMGTSDLDHVDYLDYADYIDQVDIRDYIYNVDNVDNVDNVGNMDNVDNVDNVDHMDQMNNLDHFDHNYPGKYIDSLKENVHDRATAIHEGESAPFMLLFSSILLFFGMFGITFNYILHESLKFLIFFLTPLIAFGITKFIALMWKRIAKPRYYSILSTKNLIGMEGKVILEVDEKGGVIEVLSNTPLRSEKVHAKPLKKNAIFKEGEHVYICNVYNNFFLVDDQASSIARWN